MNKLCNVVSLEKHRFVTVGDQDIGLAPNGHKEGITVHYHVDAGARTIQEIKDIEGGRLIASVREANGNIIGLIQ